jgi:pyrroloquinoline quinone biosynthesis protein D
MDELDFNSKPTLAPHARLQVDAVSGEPVLLYPEGILVLNPTAQAVLERCDGVRTLGRLIAEFEREYDDDAGAIRRDVVEILIEFRQRQLVVFPP